MVSNKYQGKILLKHIHQQFKPAVSDLTVAIASLNEWCLKQLNIKAAYLNADLEEKIYLKIPLGNKNYNKNKYWLLKKALYGLKQASRMWYKESNVNKIIGINIYNTKDGYKIN